MKLSPCCWTHTESSNDTVSTFKCPKNQSFLKKNKKTMVSKWTFWHQRKEKKIELNHLEGKSRQVVWKGFDTRWDFLWIFNYLLTEISANDMASTHCIQAFKTKTGKERQWSAFTTDCWCTGILTTSKPPPGSKERNVLLKSEWTV